MDTLVQRVQELALEDHIAYATLLLNQKLLHRLQLVLDTPQLQKGVQIFSIIHIVW